MVRTLGFYEIHKGVIMRDEVEALRQAAQSSLNRGFAVLTLEPDSKTPWVRYSPHVTNSATGDAAVVLRPYDEGQIANHGIACGRSNITVLCVEGLTSEEMHEWATKNGLPPTFTVQSPSGRFHRYYHGAVKTRMLDIAGVSVEVKSLGAYVVGAGSVIEGKKYAVLYDFDIAPLPEMLEEFPHPISVDSGFVYFLLQENLARVKIGFTSKAPTERIKQLQTANPDKLIPIFVIENKSPWTEWELHERFNEYRVSGEWFEVKGKLRRFLFHCLKRHDLKYAKLVHSMNPPLHEQRPKECVA